MCDSDGNGLISFEEWIEYLDATRLCLPKDFEAKVHEELAKIERNGGKEDDGEEDRKPKSLAEAKLFSSIQRRKQSLIDRYGNRDILGISNCKPILTDRNEELYKRRM
jgi:hypothetical protein